MMKKINLRLLTLCILQSVVIPLAVLPQSSATTPRVLSYTDSTFRIKTGPFIVAFQKGMPYIAIYDEANGPNSNHRHLMLRPGGGASGLDVFNPKHIGSIRYHDKGDEITLEIPGTYAWGNYRLLISIIKGKPGLINSRVDIQTTQNKAIPAVLFQATDPELAYDRKYEHDFVFYLNSTPGSYTYHTANADRDSAAIIDRNQFIFFGDPAVLNATVMQYVDFTSLNDYFEQTGTVIHQTVQQPEGCLGVSRKIGTTEPYTFGFDIPGGKSTVKSDTHHLVVSNTWLLLEHGVPSIAETTSYCQRFVKGIADLYSCISKPAYTFVDWPAIVERGLNDLKNLKQAHPETRIIYPQANLLALETYQARFGSKLATELLMKSDAEWAHIQTAPPYGDAWQYLYPLIMAGEYAVAFENASAKKPFLEASEHVLDLGKRLNYVFPLRISADFSNPENFRNEYDCTGAYVYLVLLYYQETGDPRYLHSARAAADRLSQMGFEFPYEFTTVSLAPVALLRLYKLTGEKRYLDAIHIPLAAIFRHSWMFNPDYGVYKGRTLFMLTEGMPGIYANGWEEASLLRFLGLLLSEGKDVLDHSTYNLIAQLLRWKCISEADALAPLLPDKSIIYKGIPREWKYPVNLTAYIPMEGYGYLEWDSSGLHHMPGRVSQSPYCFGVLPEAALLLFHPILDDALFYCEVPLELTDNGDDSMTFIIPGQGTYACRVKIDDSQKVAVTTAGSDRPVLRQVDGSAWYSFSAQAGVVYTISPSKKSSTP